MKNQKEQKTQCKTKAVRSQRIAWMLRNEGFPVINIRPNRCMPNLNVFIFEATPELCAALNEHIKNKDNMQKVRKHRQSSPVLMLSYQIMTQS